MRAVGEITLAQGGIGVQTEKLDLEAWPGASHAG